MNRPCRRPRRADRHAGDAAREQRSLRCTVSAGSLPSASSIARYLSRCRRCSRGAGRARRDDRVVLSIASGSLAVDVGCRRPRRGCRAAREDSRHVVAFMRAGRTPAFCSPCRTRRPSSSLGYSSCAGESRRRHQVGTGTARQLRRRHHRAEVFSHRVGGSPSTP